ncbi:MAG TPA: 16S rRNA (cytosine(967)-C(5))-methyltransferase RsmB [Pyrinomonadaceae bacterium]|nr:16S rRNA (cytosine(967)-C(5))-methyltransferase RsmB [Pyrinomonadaceae bacterium]
MTGRVRIVKRAAKKGAGGRPAVSPARRAAFEVLRRVEEDGAFAAPLLANLPGGLSAEDRGLAYELTLGVLRRQLWLDRVVEHFSERKTGKLDVPVRLALRLGLFQLRLLTRVPAHAAVNESVQLAHAEGFRSAAPFVNAVLRRATREPDFDPAKEIEDPLERIAVETSHPPKLVRRWAAAFGTEEAASFARANNDSAPAAFRVNTLKADPAALVERLRAEGLSVAPSRVAPDGWRVEGGAGASATLRGLADEGLVYMQDEASQLVAHVLGARPGERVLDACAAPGSKTTHLAALAGDCALVVAGDLYEHRLRVVAETCARLGVKGVRPVALDAEAALPFADETFDRVLVDAPCTGTGTLRHNPEIRWRLSPESFRELPAIQSRILFEAARCLRRGGRLVYSTCSVEREENEEVVAAFLQTHTDFTQTQATRTWPHRDDVDGFYVASLEKQ